IPIWSMTCCQLWEEPFFFRPAASCSLILMMRSYHSERRSDSTLFASSASLHTTVKPPTRSPRTAQASRSMSPLAKPW
uniref:Uncharacterized protein n=1 Tax=Amphiprion ocellaris TaxID=80972 RepID=A0A3Q1CK18_AMPOC